METHDHWKQVFELFGRALERSPESRLGWARDQCSDEDALLKDLLSMLRADDQSGTFLSDPFWCPSGEASSLIDDDHPWPDCGRYLLVELLGQGGMGSVYRALRSDDEYQQEVCVKILRRDLVTEDLILRFRNERQILAHLNHPNIARLLDGGTTGDGRPFLVIEFVRGRTIDRYFREERPPLRDRIKFLIKVCRAVHVAHQNLVVHRDLKPSNLLIADDGEPKLLDFGIAKILAPAMIGVHDLRTRAGMAAMTPEYASPEQMLGRPVTTASDIHALGAIAYELLTERHPFRSDGSSPRDWVRAVCEQEVTRPSSVVLSKNGSSAAVRLARRLSGDLDTILLKALRKEPLRRYTSAQELADDFQRHLDGYPVIARADSMSYRLGKLIRRRKGIFVAATLVFSMVLFFVWTLLIEREKTIAEKQRAEEAVSFLVDLFNSADPDRSLGEVVTAREVVDRGAAQLSSQRLAQPELHVDLAEAIGQVYFKLGLYDESEGMLREALRIRNELEPPSSPKLARTLLMSAQVDRYLGKLEAGEADLRRSLKILSQAGGEHRADQAEVLNELGALLWAQEKYEEAEEHLRRAIAIWNVLPDQRLGLGQGMRDLAGLLRERERYEEAEGLLQDTLRIYREYYGDRHPQVAGIINNLALLDVQRGAARQAEERFREVLALQRQFYSNDHPSLANTEDNLASLLYDLGRYAEGEKLCRHALSVRRSVYPPVHRKTAASLNLLGLLLREQERFREARAVLLEAHSIWEKLYGEFDKRTVAGLLNLGDLSYVEKEFDQASGLYERALKASGEGSLGESMRDWNPLLLNRLGRLRKAQKRYEEAESLYRRALEGLQTLHGVAHPEVATSLNNLAALLRSQGRPGEAEPLLRRALKILRDQHGPEHPNVALVEKNLAAALLELNRIDEAERIARRSLRTLSKTLPEQHSWRVSALRTWARCLKAQGRFSEAEKILTDLLEKVLQVYPPESNRASKIKNDLADLRRDSCR